MRAARRGLVGFSALALVVSGMVVPAYADEVTDDDIAKSQNAEKKTQSDIASIEVRLAELSAQANDLRVSAAQAQAKSIEAQQDLSEAISQAVDAQDAANKSQLDVKAARAQLSRVSTTIYRNGAFSFTGSEYIMGAKSFQEANAKSDAYRILNNKTNRDLERFQAAETVAQTLQKRADEKAQKQQDVASRVEERAAEAEQASKDVESKVASIEQERTGLIDRLAQQKGTTAELVREQQDQREAAAKAAAEEEARRITAAAQQKAQEEANRQAAAQQAAAQQAAAESARQQELARQREAARQAAAEEAARKQEAARRAEEEARKRAAAGSSSGSSSGSSTPATPPSYSASTGQQLVAFARQFVGSPYVWGGTTPAGWDCVGFTSYVFKHFGYNTPRRTGQTLNQFWSGYTVVPASQRQPGDLMWWPGHTGIYTGNGMHIAAWNPKMGTQERAVWGNPVYLRILK